MGLSLNKFIYTGVNEFDLNFALGYASRSDVTCHASGDPVVEVEFDWLTDSRVRIVPGDLEVGAELVFARTVSKVALPVDLTSPGGLTREAVETAVKHSLYAFHELLDGRVGDVTEISDAVYQQTQEAVSTALSNYLFHSDFYQEHTLRPTLTAQQTVHFTTGGYLMDTADAEVFVLTPPTSLIEVLVFHAGTIVLSFTVSSTGVVTKTTTGDFETSLGTFIVEVAGDNYSSGCDLAIVLPMRKRATVTFDVALSDYVEIYEDALNDD